MGRILHLFTSPAIRKAAISFLVIVVLAVLIVALAVAFLAPRAVPETPNMPDLLQLSVPYDVIILFNAGGWGNAPLGEVTDFTSILSGVQRTLSELGFTSTVIPYDRTPSGPSGKLFGLRELLNYFQYSSQIQVADVEAILSRFPSKYVTVIGLSNGGALTERTMASLEARPRVYGIAAGIPAWYHKYQMPNLLNLDNDGMDKLATGDAGAIVLAILKAPFKWIGAKITNRNISFARAVDVAGHSYYWSFSLVGPVIKDFLKQLRPVSRQKGTEPVLLFRFMAEPKCATI